MEDQGYVDKRLLGMGPDEKVAAVWNAAFLHLEGSQLVPSAAPS